MEDKAFPIVLRMRIMRYIFLFATLLSLPCHAQETAISDEEQIKRVVNQFFESLEKKDTLLLKYTTMETAQVWSYSAEEDPSTATSRSILKDVSSLSALPPVKEIPYSFKIEAHNGIGMAWVPYEFRIRDELVHCGVDVFSLLKMDDSWKIATITYSRQKLNCDQVNQLD